jgi:nucleoside-triphosphatase
MGHPKSGKSTLIAKLVNYFVFERKYSVQGFLTPEVKKSGKRIGFDVEDINTKERKQLAREGNFGIQHKLGKYCVFIEEFENYLSKFDSIERLNANLIVIDEIGKMELFSFKFQEWIKKIFQLEIPIIATVGLALKHPLKDYILNLPNIKLLNLTRQNQNEVFQEIKYQISFYF